MTRTEKLKYNEMLAKTWADDDCADYTRSVLLSMVHASQNPNHAEHAPLSPETCRKWARIERTSAVGFPPCREASDTLFALADKLYDLAE